MATTVTRSFSIKKKNDEFLANYDNKSELINIALDLYRREKLRREMIEGFEAQDEDDLYLANAGMGDYLRIIEESENE